MLFRSCFVPFVEIVFISSNTESIFTHEAWVTISSVVTGLQVCQRLGVEAVEGAGPIPGASSRCPGQTLCATLALFCAIVPWTLGPRWLPCTRHNTDDWEYEDHTHHHQESLSTLLWIPDYPQISIYMMKISLPNHCSWWWGQAGTSRSISGLISPHNRMHSHPNTHHDKCQYVRMLNLFYFH